MRKIEFNFIRIIEIILITICLALIPVLGGSAVISLGLVLAVVVYDFGTAIGQRRNFIKDAEKRGMRRYAEDLRQKKI